MHIFKMFIVQYKKGVAVCQCIPVEELCMLVILSACKYLSKLPGLKYKEIQRGGPKHLASFSVYYMYNIIVLCSVRIVYM